MDDSSSASFNPMRASGNRRQPDPATPSKSRANLCDGIRTLVPLPDTVPGIQGHDVAGPI
jgi:hypothetical protein